MDATLSVSLSYRCAFALIALCLCLEPVCGEAVSISAVRVITFGDPDAVDENPQRQSAVVSAVAIAPDGSHIVAAGDDHVIRVFDAATGDMTQQLEGHTDWVRGLSLSGDGKTVVSVGADQCCRTWNTRTGDQLSVTDKFEHPLRAVVFHPNGLQFAAPGFCCSARIYSLSGGHLSLEIACPQHDHAAVAFSPDGKHLAVGSGDGQLRIWDVTSGQQIQLIDASERRLRAIAYSPDGTTIATGGDGPTVTLWDPATGERRQAVYVRPTKVFCLKFIDADQLAVAGSDNRVQIWRTNGPSLIKLLEGHTGTITSLAVDAKGTILASGSFDTTIRVWHLIDTASSKTATRAAMPTR